MENTPDSIDTNKNDKLVNEQMDKNTIQKNENVEKKEKNEIEKKTDNKDKNSYFSKVKEYLSKNSHDEEYFSIIKEKPDLLFERMNETRLIIWETYLYNISSPSRKTSDCDVLCALLDREDQKIIRNDCKRTRVKESILLPGFPKILEAFLTYYCTSKDIHYKQGLNEVFGPLILLKYKFKHFKFSKLYELGEVFIDQFLPNYFYEKDLYSLQSSLSLFLILLRYHEPSVYNRLDVTEIRPEAYATNSITTLMSGKLKLNLVYELMEKIIQCQDPLIMHFILVALFIHQREMIINCDKFYVATLMTTLTITSIEELNTIFNLALKLREQTPYSYRILVNKIGFLKKNNKDIKKTFELYQPQSIPAMPIFPTEIFNITNRNRVDCIDPECKNCKLNENYINDKDNINNEYEDLYENRISDCFLKFQENIDNHICEKCDMKIEKKMQHILLDLRILKYEDEDDDTEKTGFLPMMINVDQDELKSEEFSKIITNRFLVERGNYHFIFLTSSTDTFSDFERDYYTDNLSELDKKKMMFGLIKQQKIDKELNLENAQKNLTWKDIYKLKEYDNFRNTLKTMQKQNFPYIGYVYGGFDEVHEESFKYNYELLFHNEENCFLCQAKKIERNKKIRKSKREKVKEEEIKNEISGNLWEHKTKIKYSKINETYKGKNTSLHFCILTKYKNKRYDNDKLRLLITILNDEYLMEFYKFEKQRQYNDIGVTNDDKEKKRKQSEYYDLGKEANEEKEPELILFDKISAFDIISLNSNNKSKNIVNIQVKEKDKDKDKRKSLRESLRDSLRESLKRDSVKRDSMNTFEIILDFASTNDSKEFINSFKQVITEYKAKKK